MPPFPDPGPWIRRRDLLGAASLGIASQLLPSARAAASPDGQPAGVDFLALEAVGGVAAEFDDADGRTYRIHAFATDGEFEVEASGSPGTVDLLVVAGGGGGGIANGGGGGGGAGGVVLALEVPLAVGTYSVVVGAAGAGTSVTLAYSGASAPTDDTAGRPGGSSSFAPVGGPALVTATGGGGGGGESGTDAAATSGGSGGGGGGRFLPVAGTGIEGQGSAGADGVSNGNAGGGGGGAGAPGLAPRGDTSGAGGVGRDLSALFGTAHGDEGWFGGGGGGGDEVAGDPGYLAPASGSRGGGGLGGKYTANNSETFRAPTKGVDGTGGGGGGSGDSRTSLAASTGSLFQSQAGGTGIVLIRYPITG
jgi:hypothetical protein